MKPSDLTRIGSWFFAAALIQAPAMGTSYAFSNPVTGANPITVGASQESTQQQAAMSLEAPPVLLLHGIWGTADSLAQIQGFLAAQDPWLHQGTSVQAIAYPSSIAFDATASSQALHANIERTINGLDQQHIVGGRIDIVAHSMGGLLVRHYTTLTDPQLYNGFYLSLRNRNEGVFHTVVSLDTPEYGSALASFLLSNAKTKFNPDTDPISSAIWQDFAGCSTTDTVQACFARQGMPVASAVTSLIPGGSSIANAPFPDQINNVIWRSVSAIRPLHATVLTGESMLQVELERLIRAAFPAGTSPSISNILDSAQNDVIVSLTSQLAKLAGYPKRGDFVTLPNLAHTPAPTPLPFRNWSLNDGNVLNDPTTDAIISCWLQTSGSAGCSQTTSEIGASQVSAVTDAEPPSVEEQSSGIQAPHLVMTKRLSVAPLPPLQLATPAQINLQITGPDQIFDLTVSQSDGVGHHVVSHPVLKPGAGGSKIVEVTPEILGAVRLTFAASFQNDDVAGQNVDTNVGLPDFPPERFFADINDALYETSPGALTGQPHTLTLRLAPQTGEYDLEPCAIYATLPKKLIDVGSAVTYSIINRSGLNGVVRFASPGVLQALGKGTATIEARFGSLVDDVQVTVEAP